MLIFFCSLLRKWNLGLGMRLEPRNKGHSVGLRYSGVLE